MYLRTMFRYLGLVVLVLMLSVIGASTLSAQQIQGDLPDFFKEFVMFYTGENMAQLWRYVHPNRGLTQNGYLLSYDEVKADFQALGNATGKIQGINVIPEDGFYLDEDYYRIKCDIDYTVADYTQRVPTVMVFEKINDAWFLVQSETVELTDQFRPFDVLTVGYKLLDIQAKTNTNRVYNSGQAASKGKATVLYFFSLWDIYGEVNTAFFMDILSTYASEDDVYIFGVTDDDKGDIDTWMTDNRLDFVWLYDEKSLIHYDLGILVHPMVLILDKDGRLVQMGTWKYDRDIELDVNYRSPAQKLIIARVQEVLDQPAKPKE